MYFYDSYAIFEMIDGNEHYEKYKEYPLVVCVLNIAELYDGLLKRKGRDVADKWYNNLIFDVLEITPDLIVDAVLYRYKHRKEDISLVDAIGYLLSVKHGLKFLTGDSKFKNKENVEYVK